MRNKTNQRVTNIKPLTVRLETQFDRRIFQQIALGTKNRYYVQEFKKVKRASI